jgi:hypothetical protein
VLTNTNADVAGANAPECSTNDKARVQAGQVEEQSRKQSNHSRAHGAAHQAREMVLAPSNSTICRATPRRCATTPSAASARVQVGILPPVATNNSDVPTREARCLSITRGLRRIGHSLLARDDGMWIVRAGAT